MSDQYVSIKVPAMGSISVKTIKLVVRSDEGETLVSGNVAMQFDAQFGDELVIMSPEMVTALFGHPTMQRLYESTQVMDKPRPVTEIIQEFENGLYEEKRIPDEWCAEYETLIADPDGWRESNAPGWEEPITLIDFYRRLSRSTARVGARTRLATDVKNLRRRQNVKMEREDGDEETEA